MRKVEVFEPAMCCSTGVCGVEVDPALAQFAADLNWLQQHGVLVERHNLGQDPGAFASNAAVVGEMERGIDRLPILTVDGRVVSTGLYPSRQQLLQKLGMTPIVESAEEGRRTEATGSCCSAKPGCC